MASAQTLPTDSQARKNIPLARGCLDYFPAALAAVAELSLAGNKKHNPGEELHHARGKSSDHADTILRHLLDRGTVDPDDGILHSTKVAWRALALLQEELEASGAPLARGARAAEAVEDQPETLVVRDDDEVLTLTRMANGRWFRPSLNGLSQGWCIDDALIGPDRTYVPVEA